MSLPLLSAGELRNLRFLPLSRAPTWFPCQHPVPPLSSFVLLQRRDLTTCGTSPLNLLHILQQRCCQQGLVLRNLRTLLQQTLVASKALFKKENSERKISNPRRRCPTQGSSPSSAFRFRLQWFSCEWLEPSSRHLRPTCTPPAEPTNHKSADASKSWVLYQNPTSNRGQRTVLSWSAELKKSEGL